MKVIGFEKLTLVDYPGKVACILFTGGCNMRCPYCHNGELVLYPDQFPPFDDEEIFSYIEKRRNVLDAVVISGGEPTLQSGLEAYIRRLREYGLLVKLDTNGARPDILEDLVSKGLLDYVAMDVKNSLELYPETVGIPGFDTAPVIRSIDYLKSGVVEYEFRTTVTRETHGKKSFESLASLLAGSEHYYIQNFVPNENTIRKDLTPLSYEELQNYIGILRKTIKNVQIREL